MTLRDTNPSPSLDIRTALEFLPDATINRASVLDLSGAAREYFESQSASARRDRYVPLDFSGAWIIRQPGVTTEVVGQSKRFGPEDIDENAYLFEHDPARSPDDPAWRVGRGRIRFEIAASEPGSADRPRVGYSRSYVQRAGHTTRRLQVMNAISQGMWGLPLHSDTNFVELGAEKAWQRLMQEGRVQRYLEDESPRYCFIERA